MPGLDPEREEGSSEVASAASSVPCPLPSSLDPGTTDGSFCPQIRLWAKGHQGAESWWLLQSPSGYSYSYEWFRLLGQDLICYLCHLSDFPGCSPMLPGMFSLLNVFTYLPTPLLTVSHFFPFIISPIHPPTHRPTDPPSHLSTYPSIIHPPIYLLITPTHSFVHLPPMPHPSTI